MIVSRASLGIGGRKHPIHRGIVAQIQEDSSRESSMLAGHHEQISEDDIQDNQREKPQSGAEATQLSDGLVAMEASGGAHF